MKHISIIVLFLMVFFSCAKKKTEKKEVKEVKEEIIEYKKTTPEWSKNATMYEVNLRQYSEEGNLKEFRKHLPRLKKMGVDILWFMPIHPIGEKNRKGTMGSYYSVKDYKAIAPQYGTLDEWKTMVKEIHGMGMYVVIDWVANHSSFDNIWIENGNKEYYTLDSVGELQPPLGTDWWDVADLNYDNPEMRRAMIDAMKFWVKETDIDGFRCDVADWVPTDFWNEARASLDSVKSVFMLAEAENPELHEKAFDMTYGWEFHFIMNDISQGKKPVSDIKKYLDSNRFNNEDYRLHFITNHDENSWKGTINERLGASQKAFGALAFTMEGMPLIYSGQEAGLDKKLEFFEKDVIEWKESDLQEFYTKLLKLNHDNEALWNGNYGGETKVLKTSDSNTLAFVREKNGNKVLVLMNLQNKRSSFEMIKKKMIEGDYKHWLTEEEANFNEKDGFAFEPWGFSIYTLNSNEK